MTEGRPDDSVGTNFRCVLAHLRRNRAPDRDGESRQAGAAVVWIPGEVLPDEPPVQTATADVDDYQLMVVEMKDAFLANVPLDVPKITWVIYGTCEDDDDAVVGSAAPSFEEAKARAELALRVHRGDFLDS